jgi:myo-inositol-1(or 4)-monophosphatase
VTSDTVLSVLHEAVSAVRASLDGLEDWGLAGTRNGQYRSDLIADRAALDVLLRAGFGVISEESGHHATERDVVVVVDPVDGSTNASRDLPWWATSLCALDRDGPVAAVVANQATGVRFDALRGGGARRDGTPLTPSRAQEISGALVLLNGHPPRHLGWSQYRCLGAAALDLCAVACGSADAFADFAAASLAPWDYLGGLLVCNEAGAVVREAFGRDLVVTEPGQRRTVVAAGTTALADELAALRRDG